MNWKICTLQPEYLDNLRQLYLESRLQTLTWLDASTFKRDDFDSATAAEKLLVAVNEGKPISVVSWWLSDSFIHYLYVSPRFLHQGLAPHYFGRVWQISAGQLRRHGYSKI